MKKYVDEDLKNSSKPLTLAEKIKLYAHFECPEGKLHRDMLECQKTDCPSGKGCFYYLLPDRNLLYHATKAQKSQVVEYHGPFCGSCDKYRQSSCTFYSLRDVVEPQDQTCIDFEVRKNRRR